MSEPLTTLEREAITEWARRNLQKRLDEGYAVGNPAGLLAKFEQMITDSIIKRPELRTTLRRFAKRRDPIPQLSGCEEQGEVASPEEARAWLEQIEARLKKVKGLNDPPPPPTTQSAA